MMSKSTFFCVGVLRCTVPPTLNIRVCVPFFGVVACRGIALNTIAEQAMAAACSGSLRTLDLKGLALVTDTSLVSRAGREKQNTRPVACLLEERRLLGCL